MLTKQEGETWLSWQHVVCWFPEIQQNSGRRFHSTTTAHENLIFNEMHALKERNLKKTKQCAHLGKFLHSTSLTLSLGVGHIFYCRIFQKPLFTVPRLMRYNLATTFDPTALLSKSQNGQLYIPKTQSCDLNS